MADIPMETGFLLSGLMFLIGLVGLLARRNILFMLMSLEIMLNATGLAFVFAWSHWSNPDGQVMFIFILTVAAAEVAVALAIVLKLYKKYNTLNSDEYNTMRH